MKTPPHLSLWPIARDWRPLAVGVAVTLSLLVWALYFVRSRRLTPAQLEERRRLHLAAHGRIIDGVLIDAQPTEQEPAVVFYTYRVAGVRYECSQHIQALPLHAPGVLRVDAPIQVRYLPNNPGNSIVLAETWNGLW